MAIAPIFLFAFSVCHASEVGICEIAGNYAAQAYREKSNDVDFESALISMNVITHGNEAYNSMSKREKKSFDLFVEGVYTRVYKDNHSNEDGAVKAEKSMCEKSLSLSKEMMEANKKRCDARVQLIASINEIKLSGASKSIARISLVGSANGKEHSELVEGLVDFVYGNEIKKTIIEEIYTECLKNE